MLSCMVSFKKPSNLNKCGDTTETVVSTVARKMTSDIAPSIINNAYFKPSHRTPYYSINSSVEEDLTLDSIINPCDDIVETKKEYRLDLMVGNSSYTPTSVFVNYLKTPNIIRLREDDLYGADNTKQLEFPEYVCYEIINEFTKLLLENTADPRLSTNVPINQSIIGEISAE